MLITERKSLAQYGPGCRIWQGIPGIERTRGGRLFAAFYSGGTKEELGNYCVLTYSDDDGETWLDPAAVADAGKDARCFDPCLWIDPLGRLWFFWSVMPDHAVWAAVCDTPDRTPLQFCEPFIVGRDVMMNKPIVLPGGDWLLPIAVWDASIRHICVSEEEDRRPFVYKSNDNGRSFVRLGGPKVAHRSYDEHMVLELKDHSLLMLTRTVDGIAESRSYDGGETWLKGKKSAIQGPSSRFFLRRLASGRVLLINHYDFNGRNNLTAMLSEDECRTWQGFLLLDERDDVSYPDAVQAENGDLYIIYDRGRGSYLHSLEEAYDNPREILMARITEEDILAGKPVSPRCCLKKVINKLGLYTGPEANPYDQWANCSLEEYAARLARETDNDRLTEQLFKDFGIRCMNITRENSVLLDKALDELANGDADRDPQKRLYFIRSAVSILRAARVTSESTDVNFVIDALFRLIAETLAGNLTLDEMAERLHVSKYYMCHLFREKTGISIIRYRNLRRISLAKELLVGTDLPISEIAAETGFSVASYFGECFKKQEQLSPGEYRALHKPQRRMEP